MSQNDNDEQIRDNPPAGTDNEPVPALSGRPPARKRLLYIAAGALLLVLAGVGGGLYLGALSPERDAEPPEDGQVVVSGLPEKYERRYLVPRIAPEEERDGNGGPAPRADRPRSRTWEFEGLRERFTLDADDRETLRSIGSLPGPGSGNGKFILPEEVWPKRKNSGAATSSVQRFRHDRDRYMIVYQDDGLRPDSGELSLSRTGSGATRARLRLQNARSGYQCDEVMTLPAQGGTPVWEAQGHAVLHCSGSVYNWFWQPFTRDSGFMVALEMLMGTGREGVAIYLVYGLDDDAGYPLIRNLIQEWEAQKKFGPDWPGLKFSALPVILDSIPLHGFPQKYWSPRQYLGTRIMGYSQSSGAEYSGTLVRHGPHGPLTISLENETGLCAGFLRDVDSLNGYYQGPLKCGDGTELLVQCREERLNPSEVADIGECTGGNAENGADGRLLMRYGSTLEASREFFRRHEPGASPDFELPKPDKGARNLPAIPWLMESSYIRH